MLPVLFHIGSFPVRSFGVMIALGLFVALMIVKRRSQKYHLSPDKIWDLFFWMMLFGILGARLAYILTHLSEFKNAKELFTVQFEGLTSFGAVVLGLLTVLVWSKKQKLNPLLILDMLAVPALFMHVFGRIGCFLNGCCYGGEVSHSFPLGVHFHHLEGFHHPTQLYDAGLTLCGALFLILWERRKLHLGQSISAAFLIYGLARFIHEFWRGGHQGSATYFLKLPLSDAQLVSLLIIFLAGTIYMYLGKRHLSSSHEFIRKTS